MTEAGSPVPETGGVPSRPAEPDPRLLALARAIGRVQAVRDLEALARARSSDSRQGRGPRWGRSDADDGPDAKRVGAMSSAVAATLWNH